VRLKEELPVFQEERIADWFHPKRHYTTGKSNSELLGYNLAFSLPKIKVAHIQMKVSRRENDDTDTEADDEVVQFILPNMPGTGNDKKKPKAYRTTFWCCLKNEEVTLVKGAQCSCVAGRAGMCKHVAALMYLVGAIKPDKACTELLMQWQMSHAQPFDLKKPVYWLSVANHEKGRVKASRAVTAGDQGRHSHCTENTISPQERVAYAQHKHSLRQSMYGLIALHNLQRDPYSQSRQCSQKQDKKKKKNLPAVPSVIQPWRGECLAQIQWPQGPPQEVEWRKGAASEEKK
jgi:hypothetical protein